MSFWAVGISAAVAVGTTAYSASEQKKNLNKSLDAQGKAQSEAEQAQRQAIYDQMNALPLQRNIDAAAARGGVYQYTNPLTGEVQTADFRGDPDWNAYMQRPEVQAYIKLAKDTNYGYQNDLEAAKDYYQNIDKAKGVELPYTNGSSDYDLAKLQAESGAKLADFNAQSTLDLQKKYGTQFAEEALKQLQVTDPEGYALRKQFGGNLLSGANSMESLARGQPGIPTYERAQGNGPTYNEISQTPQTFKEGAQLSPLERANDANLPKFERGADAASTQAIRGGLETDAQNQLATIGTLDPALQRAAEQAARARGASSGNLLGNGAALKEAQSVQLAQLQQDQQKRQNALGMLTSGQTTTDANTRLRSENNGYSQQEYTNQLANLGQRNNANLSEFDAAQQSNALTNQARAASTSDELSRISQANQARDQSFQNAMAAIAQRNQATQSEFGAAQQNYQNISNARQQDTANQQSFLGLTPIAAQGNSLAGLQQQSAPFQYNPIQSGGTLNTSAANSFANSLFSNQQANGRQAAGLMASATSPWSTMAGSIGGSAAGAFGGMLGNVASTRLNNYLNQPRTTTTATPDPYAGGAPFG